MTMGLTADIRRTDDKTKAVTNEIARVTMICNDNDNVMLPCDVKKHNHSR